MTKSWTDERLEERFDRIDQSFDEVGRRFEAVDHRFDEVDRRFEAVDQRFDEVDRRFEAVNQRFEVLDRRFDRVDADFRELRTEMTSRFDTTQRLIIQIGAGMFATLLIGFLSILTRL